MNSVYSRLLKEAQIIVQQKFAIVLKDHIGQLSVFTHSQESWTRFIQLAIGAGVTPEEFEENLGVSEERLALWLNGKTTPSETLEREVMKYVIRRIVL